MRRLIGISMPEFEDADLEQRAIVSLLDSGRLEFFHVRKPSFSVIDMASWLEKFPARLRERLCLQDCVELAVQFGIGGVHLNKRNGGIVPDGFAGRTSCSCHSLEEVRIKKKEFDYVFLSPVFDSISKQGYKSKFPKAILQQAAREGLIDERVFALSGIDERKFGELEEMGFSAAAMMGSLWKNVK